MTTYGQTDVAMAARVSSPVNPGYDRSRRLKIVLASWAPFLAGAEVACERLALGLQQEGHDVLVLLGNHGVVQERMELAGLRCLVLPMPLTDKWHWWSYWQARRACRALINRERP